MLLETGAAWVAWPATFETRRSNAWRAQVRGAAPGCPVRERPESHRRPAPADGRAAVLGALSVPKIGGVQAVTGHPRHTKVRQAQARSQLDFGRSAGLVCCSQVRPGMGPVRATPACGLCARREQGIYGKLPRALRHSSEQVQQVLVRCRLRFGASRRFSDDGQRRVLSARQRRQAGMPARPGPPPRSEAGRRSGGGGSGA